MWSRVWAVLGARTVGADEQEREVGEVASELGHLGHVGARHRHALLALDRHHQHHRVRPERELHASRARAPHFTSYSFNCTVHSLLMLSVL